jgi:hypothetical protein
MKRWSSWPSATGVEEQKFIKSHIQLIRARFSGFVAKSCLQKLNVSSLVSGDLLEPAIGPIGEACVYEVIVRELGEAMSIEGILHVLQGKGEIENVNS